LASRFFVAISLTTRPNESPSSLLNHPSSPPVNRDSHPFEPLRAGNDAVSGLRTSGGIVAPAISRPMAVA
jgi:hypothetical protein